MGEVYGLYCVCRECGDSQKLVRYVGQTTQGSERRFKSHLSVITSESRAELRKLPVYRWIRKHGPANIRFKVLEEVMEVGNLDDAERRWIKVLGTHTSKHGLNATPGGVGSRGYKHTDEAKGKMRENFKDPERRMKSSRPGASHPRATFTEEEVSGIKRRLWTGETATSIARDFQVPTHRVQQINVDKSWSQVPWPIGPRVRPLYRSVLSRDDQKRALEMRKEGASLREVSDHFQVSVSVIFRIEKRGL